MFYVELYWRAWIDLKINTLIVFTRTLCVLRCEHPISHIYEHLNVEAYQHTAFNI